MSDVREQLLAALSDGHWHDVYDVQRATGLSLGRIVWELHDLHEEGVVEEVRVDLGDGKPTLWRLS